MEVTISYWLLSAAILSVIVLLAHVIGGGQDVHMPILSSALNDELKAYSSIIWHSATALLTIGSLTLLWAATGKQSAGGMVSVILLQYLAFAGLFLFYGITRLDSVWIMPQWTAFLVIPALGGIGLWR